MPVREVAETIFPVDAQVLLGCGSNASGAGVSRCHPCTRLDDSMCQLARAHSLGVTWADVVRRWGCRERVRVRTRP